MDKTETLKACPFCGGPAVYVPDDSYGAERIICPDDNNCPVKPIAWGEPNSGEAIAAWNERTSRPDNALADDAVERMGAAIEKAIWADNDVYWSLEKGRPFHAQTRDALARAALSTLTPSPAVDLLREAREACFRDALAEEKQPDRERKFGLVTRIDAALKEANDG